MAKQLAEIRPFDLADLSGMLVAWRQEFAQPWRVAIEGTACCPIFANEEALRAVMERLNIRRYSVKQIQDGADFFASVAQGTVAFNVHLVEDALRYTEIRLC